jgi:tetratricopeptide (TPR) repeat protein
MKIVVTLLVTTLLASVCVAQQVSIDKERLLEFYQNQKYTEAANYLSSLYPNGVTDETTLKQIAYCHMMAGNLNEAEKNYQKINEITPNQIPILFNLTNINAKRGNTKVATTYLKAIIKVDTNNFRAYQQLASYTDSVNLKGTYLQKANQLNNADADVAYDLALIFRKLEQHSRAYNVLNTAIKADTSNLILQQALLPVANQLKQYEEVVTVGEKLLANNRDANVIGNVAKAYYFLKKYEKAIDLYKRLENMQMQNESTLYFTSLCYRELKNYAMASGYAKRTILEGISPNTAAYYNTLADIYESNNQFNSAVEAYKKGLNYQIGKNSYYRLGLLYDLKLKNKKTAAIYYHLFLNSKNLTEEDKPQIEYVKSRLVTSPVKK